MSETEADIDELMQRTMCSVQSQSLSVDVCSTARASLQQLINDGLVTRKRRQATDQWRLDVTSLGRAVYKGK